MEFVTAWKRARSPIAMRAVIEQARRMPTPPAGCIYEDQSLQLLVAVCACLQQQHGAGTFFLSVEQARKILGVSKMTAWRMLQTLRFDEIIKMVRPGEKGSRRGLKAAEYQFMDPASTEGLR
jgi:hypothetical protein